MNAISKVMKRHWRVVLALVVGFLAVADAIPAMAAGDDPGAQKGAQDPMGGMMRGMRMGPSAELLGRERPMLSLALRHRAELALSAEQIKTLEGLVERFRKDAEGRVSQIESAEQELAGLLKSDPSDVAAVEAKVRAIEALRGDLRIARIRTIAEGRAALSAEQRKKLEELVASRPGGHASERTRGMEEMERFMSSDRMPQALTGMMDMARRMGDGDAMLGMVRMMEMMGSMGGGGMMGGEPPHETPPAQK